MEEYDEFGNYIGPAVTDNPADLTEVPEDQQSTYNDDTLSTITATTTALTTTARHARDLFPSAEATFGSSVQIVVNDQDTMTLEDAVVKERDKRTFTAPGGIADTHYTEEHLRNVLLMRHFSVALVGPMHSGKSSILEMLIEGATGRPSPSGYLTMDSHELEASRHISMFMKPMTVILKGTEHCRDRRSHAVTVFDSPGHLDFWQDRQIASRYASVLMVCVDAVEGVVMAVEDTLLGVADSDKRVILLINKIDRLILECKLTPLDCYSKLKHLIDSCNTVMGRPNYFDPAGGNVVFASAQHRWMFTIDSFMARMYPQSGMPVECMFGDVYSRLDTTGQLMVSSSEQLGKRTFVEYVLEPLYKMYTVSLGGGCGQRRMRSKDMKWSAVVRRALTNSIGWDCDYLFDTDSVYPIEDTIEDTNGNNVTMAVSYKAVLFERELGFLVQVKSGRLDLHDTVNVTSTGQEWQAITLSRMFVYQAGRRLVPIRSAVAGNVVFLPGTLFTDLPSDAMFTLTSSNTVQPTEMSWFEKRRQQKAVTCKVGVEPLLPGDLPRLQAAVKRALLVFPSLLFAVEETGEHCLTGPGELYMDTVLAVLRSGQLDVHNRQPTSQTLEFRVSDPAVAFCETVTDQSTVTCYADTPNGTATVCMLCEPVESALVEALEGGLLAGRDLGDQLVMSRVGAILRDTFKWDQLAARSIMAVGPDPQFGTNLLLYDILDPTVSLTGDQRAWCVQAFQWACRQGPLVEAPVRGVKFRLVDFRCNPQHNTTAGQVIPTIRRACFAAMVTATCKLVEPVLECEVVCGWGCREAVLQAVSKRRGHVQSETACPGTPWHLIRYLLPAVDSFGAETDVRIACQGLCTVQCKMHHWQPVPGDPMSDQKMPPLVAAPAPLMSRDFINKTRRRKGLAEDLKVERFLDDRMMRALAALDI